MEGTKKNPGGVKKCYDGDDARSRAVAYLAALNINVHHKHYGRLFSVFKSDDAYKWFALSTVAHWDKQGEMVTTAAMDYDIRTAAKTSVYPWLRMFHVRGFIIGKCTSMHRIGKYAFELGYWRDHPFAHAVYDMVLKDAANKWKISRGFYSIKAAGLCTICNTSLSVGLIQYVLGVTCQKCGAEHGDPLELLQLKHLQTVTFDLSLTDVPVVGDTAIAAYAVTTS